jgi:hypothetical protein
MLQICTIRMAAIDRLVHHATILEFNESEAGTPKGRAETRCFSNAAVVERGHSQNPPLDHEPPAVLSDWPGENRHGLDGRKQDVTRPDP